MDGVPVVDPGWPDELLLDMSTDDRRGAITSVVGDVIEGCATAGFDAVEIDNLDSYSRSAGRLTLDDAVDLVSRYAAVAHEAGLAIAQKNTAELGVRGRDEAGLDFAVVEECHRWDECSAYTQVYGDAVIDVEYADDLRGSFSDVCADSATPVSTVMRDRALVTPHRSGYVFAHC